MAASECRLAPIFRTRTLRRRALPAGTAACLLRSRTLLPGATGPTGRPGAATVPRSRPTTRHPTRRAGQPRSRDRKRPTVRSPDATLPRTGLVGARRTPGEARPAHKSFRMSASTTAAASGRTRDKTIPRRAYVHECFIDDQQPAPPRQQSRCVHEDVRRQHAAIGVVGVHHHANIERSNLGKCADRGHVRPRGSPARLMLTVGETQNADTPRRENSGQPLDQRLSAGCGDDLRQRSDTVGGPCGSLKGAELRGLGKPGPGGCRDPADRIRHRIDPGGQIDPRLRRMRKPGAGEVDIAAVIP